MSIPAPVYYAHLVAFRARHHIIDSREGSSDGASVMSGDRQREPNLVELNKKVQIHEDANKVMYFAWLDIKEGRDLQVQSRTSSRATTFTIILGF